MVIAGSFIRDGVVLLFVCLSVCRLQVRRRQRELIASGRTDLLDLFQAASCTDDRSVDADRSAPITAGLIQSQQPLFPVAARSCQEHSATCDICTITRHFGTDRNLCFFFKFLLIHFNNSLTHSLTSRPSSMRVGDSKRPLRYLSSPLCSIL